VKVSYEWTNGSSCQPVANRLGETSLAKYDRIARYSLSQGSDEGRPDASGWHFA
jgi:hypothetical protein